MDQAGTLRGMVKSGTSRGRPPKTKQRRDGQDPKSARPMLVMAITSGKGGVGKTNVVSNLALALSMMNKRVLVLDADLGLSNIDVLLGLKPEYNFSHFLAGKRTLEEIMVEGPGGVRVLPASSGIQEITELSEEQRLRILNAFDLIEERYDVFLVDTGAGISSNVMYFNVATQVSIVVVTPEPTSITDAYALMKVLSIKHGRKKFQLLVNQARSEQEAIRVFENLTTVAGRFLNVSIGYLGHIPTDENIPNSVRQQKAVLELYPNSEASRRFKELALKVSSYPGTTGVDGGVQFFWRHLLDVQTGP